ncbi:B2 protein [Nicotiana tomentosiformis]|uniref:B2 protein n=1 Tax=Nicotiana tomentosiformis TaxID=4098 RepID=UPI00051AF000|nr:B2 protein-like [Nicotiana tomentosiformis]XP_018622599.1 B2 protein-like [Nicotiana tomentosiformis]
MENNNQSSFWQFSDQLRLQNNNLANLSLSDSIWSNNYVSKRPEERRNFDIRVGGDINNNSSTASNNSNKSNYNLFSNDGWKIADPSAVAGAGSGVSGKGVLDFGLNGGFNKGIYSNQALNFNYSKGINNIAVNTKGVLNKKFGKGGVEDEFGYGNNKSVKKNNKSNNKESNNKDVNGEKQNGVDKRFKTLPPAESLPRNETVGGYIFVCNNDTMAENLKRELFGLPPRYRDSVRQITPGLPLFLYNYSTHQLHGVFEAASFGGSNIDPSAWEDKKNPGESRFPAQVRVVTRKVCEPLEEDSFRPILHHYDGPKFRLELNVPEALSLLDIFEENKN